MAAAARMTRAAASDAERRDAERRDAERRDATLRRDGVSNPKSVPIAPSVYLLPGGLLFLIHLTDRQSRAHWKRLPLDSLPPTGAGPVLVFDVFDGPVTWLDEWSGRTLHSTIELHELIADHLKFRRSADPIARAKLAKRIRRRWVALVDHAIGYRVPGTPDVLEFA